MRGANKTVTNIVRNIPVAIFVVVSATLAFSLTNDPGKMPSTLIDKPTPKFSLPALQGGGPGLASQDLKGDVVLLNVFASWCPGCRVEHPTLLRLSSDGRIPLYGVNWKDKPGDGARWLAANKSPYRQVGDDRSGRLGIDLGVTGVPETFVIDRTGRIRYRHAGPVTEDIWQEIFTPLLAELRGER
jgi:cytochrome c biogenesis protein CcmG, thiol:disulfide interchange protein DsbE